MGLELRVYYEDTDAGGVVYHARYLGFLERARTEFLREHGLSVKEMADSGEIFPVVRLEVDFRAAAVLDDAIVVETEPLQVGKTSFTMLQRIVRKADSRLLVEAKVTLVCVAPGMKARRLPASLLRALTIDQA